jgi:hypothetical protein
MGQFQRGLSYLVTGRLGTAIRFKRRRRLLRPQPDLRPDSWLPSVRRINRLLSEFQAPTAYLEIGVDYGFTLENILATERVGVDPNAGIDQRRLPAGLVFVPTTSDAFFADLDVGLAYDVIFLDGLHTCEQTYRDLVNALRHLKPGGAILIDDTVPSDAVSAIPDLEASRRRRRELGMTGGQWHGDVFGVVWIISRYHPELAWATITDRGNPQTLVWVADGDAGGITYQPELVLEASSLVFETCFAEGIPPWMHPSLEDVAIVLWSQTRAHS